MSELKYYSQINQDKVVIDFYKGMRNGYFVELGAADGVCISNTYAMESQLGWDGLCVEPHEGNFAKMQAVRKCTLDNSFILADGVEVEYHQQEDVGHKESLFSSMHPWAAYADRKKTVRKIMATSLYTLFEKHHVPTIIHYMSVDLDGCDYDVLKEYFGREYPPVKTANHTHYVLTLTVEHNGKEPARSNFRELLTKYNYVVTDKVPYQDDFYVHKAVDILL